MNILILENVGHLDNDYLYYVKKEYGLEDNVEVLFNLSYKIETDPNNAINEIKEKLAWADKVSVCSSLSENVDNLLPLIQQYENIKHIDIKYLFSKDVLDLCKDLNNDRNDIIFDLVKNRNVTEILINTFKENNDNQFFSKHLYTYTTAKLVYVKEYDCIWHSERVTIPDINDFIYDTVGSKNKTITIDRSDIGSFNSLVNEVVAFVNYQKELITDNPGDDSEELLEEKNSWLNIIKKYF